MKKFPDLIISITAYVRTSPPHEGLSNPRPKVVQELLEAYTSCQSKKIIPLYGRKTRTLLIHHRSGDSPLIDLNPVNPLFLRLLESLKSILYLF